MFFDAPIIKNNSGYLDYMHERSIVLKWLDYCGLVYEEYEFGQSKGFYLVKNEKKLKKIYLCCTRDIGRSSTSNFWFGFPLSHVRGNSDTGIIFIMVWEDRRREYLVFNNNEMLKWRNNWYIANDYFSVDVDVKKGQYLMRGKNAQKKDVRNTLNNILSLFD